MAKDIEYLFMYFSAISENYLFNLFAHLLIRFFFAV
jgi:hypothetical protein